MRKVVVVVIMFLFIIIFVSFLYLNNTSTKRYNVNEKFKLSNVKVIGYGVYQEGNAKSFGDLIDQAQNFLDQNKDYKGKIYFIVGNEKELKLISYEDFVSGSIGLSIDSKYNYFFIRKDYFDAKTLVPKKNVIDVEINGKNYSIQLNKNENSYFIIYQNESQ